MTRQHRYRKRKPWVRFVEYARRRCRDVRHKDYHAYGGRGIRCELTAKELERVWSRDRAQELKRPSLDRIDSDGHYVLENCRFIEFAENARLASTTYRKTIRSCALARAGRDS